MSATRTATCPGCKTVYWRTAGHSCGHNGPSCPGHGLPLSGGPILWHCPAGEHGHGITAADLVAAWEVTV